MTFDHSDLIVRKLIPSQMRALWEPDSPSDLMESGELQILRGWRGCQLDSQECLSLDQILHSFSAPISEEHAWAVIHQVSRVTLKTTMFIYCLGQQSTFVYDVTQSGNTHSRGDIPTGQLEHFMSSSNVQNVGTFIELLKMLLELVWMSRFQFESIWINSISMTETSF